MDKHPHLNPILGVLLYVAVAVCIWFKVSGEEVEAEVKRLLEEDDEYRKSGSIDRNKPIMKFTEEEGEKP